MSLPIKYRDTYFPIKYFLTSYRALSDGKRGVWFLEDYLASKDVYLSQWKVIWIGACTLLRSAVDLFQVDAKSCINEKIRREIEEEWNLIKSNKQDHSIYWEFIRKERNNIVHEYEWAAYEIWMDREGNRPPMNMSLLGVKPEDVSSVLIMRNGYYKGCDSLDLLKESADWVEERIFASIRRAGFDPEESRNLISFQKRSPPEEVQSRI